MKSYSMYQWEKVKIDIATQRKGYELMLVGIILTVGVGLSILFG